MNWEAVVTSNVVAGLGWTLLHSLWQITLVSGGLLLALRLLRDRSANVRYIASLVALVTAFILPLITFVQISQQQPGKPAATNIAPINDGRDAAKPGVRTDGTVDGNEFTDFYNADAQKVPTFVGLRRYLDTRVPDVLPLLVGFWIIGVAIFAIRLGGGLWQLRIYKSHGVEPVDDRWAQRFISLRERVGATTTVRFLRSSVVNTPIAIGVFRPLIIVPASLFLQMHPRELETIIAHELIHIRRYDPLVTIFQTLIETLLFYHPGVWWISNQMSREREFAADADVMRLFTDFHVTYARALANLEEIRFRTDQQLPHLATAANGGNLMKRIQRILKIETEAGRANSAWTATLALLLTSAVLLALFSFNSTDPVNAQYKGEGRKLAIGFVSIPPVDRTENAPKDSEATARLLIHALKKHKVPATGFLQGGMISDGEKFFPVRREIARMWIDAGFEVGLGGFNHISLYHRPVDEYIANIEKNETVAKKLLGDMGFPPRYFSYPYLNTGKTIEDRVKVEAWLARRGYTSVKYSFDNNEWMYSYAYDMARNDNDVNTMKEIREAYLTYMSRMFDHYEAYTTEMFGRDIAQTMVLTPSRLVTDTADDFFAMAKKRGYSFVSVDEAQSDPAYKSKEGYIGDAGISWFERWALARDTGLREEPRVDRAVERVWEARNKTAK
jgi:beta-lactamase regulating signal transducer with metallopeptidase domain/peptidoglycan/xylan/chitin deacetylase (PgdA/CDA1 family)